MPLNKAATVKDKTARIMIVDDHPVLREGLAYRISSQPDMTVCAQAADVGEALKKICELNPDMVIVDIALKTSDGLELIKALKARHGHVRALVYSMYEEVLYADRCLRAGARGYLNKEANPNDVIDAIREILAGRVYLSPTMTSRVVGRAVSGATPEADPIDSLTDRQLEVFRLIGQGLTAHEVADRLHISIHTVETHRENIKRKLNVTTASELARHAVLWATQGS
ncbi:MAG: response regulator transcription factor [Pirellulales bacterium]